MHTKVKSVAITLSVLGVGLFSQQLDANAMGVSNLKESDPQAYQKMADEDEHAKIKDDSITAIEHQQPGASTSIAYVPGVPTISITDKARPRTDAIDISSNNGSISVDSFKQMKKYGVKTIIIKATEFNTYRNPIAKEQMANAKAAGLNVMFYHYDWFSNQTEARREANYFADYLDTLGINKNTKVFDDLEEGYTKTSGITGNVQAFRDQLSKRGYKNAGTYTFEGLIQSTNLNTTALNRATVWNAQYPYNPLASNLWQTDKGAWQFSSAMTIPGVPGKFDASIDYKNLLVDKPTTSNTVTPKPNTSSQGSSSSSEKKESGSSKSVSSSVTSESQSQNTSNKPSAKPAQSSSQTSNKGEQIGDVTDKSKVESSKNDSELKNEANANVNKQMIDEKSLKSNLKHDERPDVKAYQAKQKVKPGTTVTPDKKASRSDLKHEERPDVKARQETQDNKTSQGSNTPTKSLNTHKDNSASKSEAPQKTEPAKPLAATSGAQRGYIATAVASVLAILGGIVFWKKH